MRGIVRIAAIAALGLALTGCGEDDPEPDTGNPVGDETSVTVSSSAPESSAAPEDDGGTAAGDVTAPGTELEFGETATVPFEYAGKEGTIAVTVTDLEKGTEADLKDFGEKAKGMTPYFIRFSVENVGGTDMSRMSLKLDGVSGSGERTGVSAVGDIDKCDNETGPADFTEGSFETCSLAVSSGAEVEAVQFAEGDGYERVDGKPVTWK